MALRTKPFEGTLVDAIEHVSKLPEGRNLLTVLKAIQSEIDSPMVQVSADLHRVYFRLRNGKLGTVRVTNVRQARQRSTPMLRFKSSRNLHNYELLYFGGVNAKGFGWYLFRGRRCMCPIGSCCRPM